MGERFLLKVEIRGRSAYGFGGAELLGLFVGEELEELEGLGELEGLVGEGLGWLG